jgi:hypothetical protein
MYEGKIDVATMANNSVKTVVLLVARLCSFEREKSA